jgi:undecaprenyl-phosphate galactose phosphotransferase/putative colanic acid biosynthesis UDP-glucose lipid carrier transferase
VALLAGSELRAEAPRYLEEYGPDAASSSVQQDALSNSRVANWQNDSDRPRDRPPQRFQVPCSAIGGLFAGVDSATVVLASLLGANGYQFLISGAPWNLHIHVGAGATAALLYFLIGRSSGFYQVTEIFSSGRRDFSEVFWQWLLTSLLLTLLAFLLRIGVEFSRGSIICFFVCALLSLFASRSLMKASLSWAVGAGRVQGRRVVMVGLRDELAAISQVDLLRRFGLTEVERTALPSGENWSLPASKKILSSLDDALRVARDRGAEEIVLALSWNDTRSIELIRDRLRSSPLPVQLLPDQKVRYLTGIAACSVSRSLSIELQRTPLSELEQFEKRVLDIVGACAALVMLLPVMLVTALAIKLDSPGPVLFRQCRSGFNAKRFLIFKFRTMTVMEDGASVSQATRHDPRITKFGGILRATSIDELPQLFNVLRGDMSLAGPRPHAVAHDDQYGKVLADYAYRHHVKPGITGWAQIHGCRGNTAQVELMKKRLDLDLWYISNWNVGLDFVILLRTFVEVMRHRNAY